MPTCRRILLALLTACAWLGAAEPALAVSIQALPTAAGASAQAVASGGQPPYRYRWSFDGADAAQVGGDAPTLAEFPIQPFARALVFCTVSDAAGGSARAFRHILPLPPGERTKPIRFFGIGDNIENGGGAWDAGQPAVIAVAAHLCEQAMGLPAGGIPWDRTGYPGYKTDEIAANLPRILERMTAFGATDVFITVLVTGLGPVGNLAAQLAALQGARVIGCDLDPARLALARTCGLTDCLAGSPETQVEAMQALTNGEGASVLIEATGRAATAQAALPLLGQNAEVILLGTPRQPCPTDLTAFLMPFHLATRALRLKPAHEWIYPVRHDPFVKHSFTRNTRIVYDLIAAKRLRLDPLITQVVPPSDAPAMYEGLRQRRPELVGVVFDWQ
jgi:hypothetical protein